MTDLRFLGDWGLIPGLIVALGLAATALLLYHRELKGKCKGKLAWILPILRASAIFMVVMMLTGPVLHHSRLIGELIDLKIIIDSSQSMELTDPQMDIGRKLLLAKKLGLLQEKLPRMDTIEAANALVRARLSADTALEKRNPDKIKLAAKKLHDAVRKSIKSLSDDTKGVVAGEKKGILNIEYWYTINGSKIIDLTNSVLFSGTAQLHETITKFETSRKDWKDNYGTRISGYVTPPTSGKYKFSISGDDQCKLWLSTEPDGKNKQLIASVPTFSGYGEWRKVPQQTSKDIQLEAGKNYYVEVLHKEGMSQDFIAVGWTLPDGKKEFPIPASRLSIRETKSTKAWQEYAMQLIELDPTDEKEYRELVTTIEAVSKTSRSAEKTLRQTFRTEARKLLKDPKSKASRAVVKLDAMTRWQRIQAMLLDGETPVLGELAANYDVQLLATRDDFDEAIWNGRAGRLKDTDQIPRSFPLDANAISTDLNSAISVAQADDSSTKEEDNGNDKEINNGDQERKHIVVLISDGCHNKGESPIQKAKIYGNKGVKLFTVAMGSPKPAGDIAVAHIEKPTSVFVQDRAKGRITLEDTIPAGEPFQLKLISNNKTVWEKQLVSQGKGTRYVDYDFPVKGLTTGNIEQENLTKLSQNCLDAPLTVAITGLKNDRETKNNSKKFNLRILTQKYKLLIVESRPRWEERFVANMFERDSGWKINRVVADDKKIKRGDNLGEFPTTRDGILDYDIIWIGDISAEMFLQEELKWLKEFVSRRGGGLILVDGQRHHMQSLMSTPLHNLLPVKWNSDDNIPVAPKSLRLTDAGNKLAALQFSSETNRAVWASLKVPQWTANITALPGSEVLAESIVNEQPIPSIVTRRYGTGKVLYLGIDEIWRWRYRIGDKYHERFWRQVALWVMEQPFTVQNQYLAIDTGAGIFTPGESAPIRVKITDAEGKAISNATAHVQLYDDEQLISSFTLQPDDIQPGVYRTKTDALEPGIYDVKVKVVGMPKSSSAPVHTKITVKPKEFGELSKVSCNITLLNQIATHGRGRMFYEEDIGELLQTLEPFSQGKVIESDTVFWQSYWWFIAIMSLLTVEWFLRRKNGLM